MTKDQKADFAYNEEKLIRLLVRRRILPPNSGEVPGLLVEINAVEDLVRSYRLVQRLSE